MRSTGTTLLAAAALGVVTYHYNSPRPNMTEQLASVTRIHTAAPDDVGTHAFVQPRVFSPQRPLLASTGAQSSAVAVGAVSGEGRTVAAAAPQASAPLPPVVAIQPRKPPSLLPPAHKLASDKPQSEDARIALIRDLQKELQRVGCYEGEVDGDWGGGSKRAMRTFTERVNASLPTEDPDYILLMLVRGHNAAACGKACPTGQSFDTDGRCLPNAVLASAGKRPVGDSRDAHGVRETGTTKVATWSDRSGLQRPASGEPVLPTTGTTSGTNTLRDSTGVPPAPLPGRMSVGGPVDASATAQRSVTTAGHSGRLANLAATETDSPQTLPIIGETRSASTQTTAEPTERRGSGNRAYREQRTRATARRAPPREAQAPQRSRGSSRYSSFNRPGAVQNFFFNPQRAF